MLLIIYQYNKGLQDLSYVKYIQRYGCRRLSGDQKEDVIYSKVSEVIITFIFFLRLFISTEGQNKNL